MNDDGHKLAAKPRARSIFPRRQTKALAFHFTQNPVGLPRREFESAGQRRASGNREPQRAVRRHAHDVPARQAMARDRHGHMMTVQAELPQTRRFRRIRPRQSDLHVVILLPNAVSSYVMIKP